MKYIGPHVSAQGGPEMAVARAVELGAKAFALFTRNQRMWHAAPLTEASILAFRTALQESGIAPRHVLPHNSYLANLGSPNQEQRQRSLDLFIDEITRCEQLGLDKLNFHPGSHLGEISEEECLDNIAESINRALERTHGVTAVLENTAGQGTNMGHRFEHLAYVIDRVEDKSRIGVCIDSAHTLAAGYDIRDAESYAATWREFDRIIGYKYLRGMHINDSKKELSSHVDRHDSVGQGYVGLEFFRLMMQDPHLDDIPLILETPNPDLWAEEIKTLYGMQ